MKTIHALAAVCAAAFSVAATAQVAGTVPRGGQPAGVVPPMNPYTGAPYPTPYGSFGQPWWRPVSSVPVFMAGTSAPVPQTMTYIVTSANDWIRLYREMFPPLPYEQSYAPALVSFSNDVLVVIRLAQTENTDLIPTLDTFDEATPYTTVIRYSIWTPLEGTREKPGTPAPVSQAEKPSRQRRMFSPYIVARAPRWGGQYQFSGSVQHYRPFNYNDRRGHRG